MLIKKEKINRIPWNKGKKENRIEVLRKMSDNHKGIPAWNKGKSASTDSRRKMSVYRKGKTWEQIYGSKTEILKEKARERMIGKKIDLGCIAWNKGSKGLTGANRSSFVKGSKHSEEWKVYMSRIMKDRCLRGIHILWRGGKTPLIKLIRTGYRYRQWRCDVFTRDDFTCQFCGLRGGKLQADHIKPFAQLIEENKISSFEEADLCEELWNINNGRTLCRECHKKTETYGNRKGKTHANK